MTILKHVVEAGEFQAIPENLRSIYQQGEDGKFSIPEPLRPVADAVTGLFKANGAIRDENKQLKAKGTVDLSPLADFGEDIPTIAEQVKARLAELETAAADGKANKLNIDKVRDELKRQHTTELEKRAQREQKLTGAIHRFMVTSVATEALAAEEGLVELALPFVERFVKVVEDGDEFRTVVVDADGDTRISGATGKEMSIRELVQEMKRTEKYQPLFKSQAKGGGGADPRGGQRRPAGNPENRSAIDKIKAGLSARK